MSDALTRYAAALCDALRDLPEQDRNAVFEQGLSLATLLRDDPELPRFLASPAFAPEEKESVLDAIADRLGLAPALRELLRILSANRRAALFGATVAEAERLHRRREGIAELEITAVDPLDHATLATLRPALERLFGPRLHIDCATDPSLLGGLTVRRGDTIYDLSLRNQIRRLHKHLREGERRDA